MRNPKQELLRMMFFGAIGFIHGFVPLFTLRNEFWPTASNDSILFAAIYAFLGVLALSAGWYISDVMGGRKDHARADMTVLFMTPPWQGAFKKVFWAALLIGIPAWLTTLLLRYGSITAAFFAARFEHRFLNSSYWEHALFRLDCLLFIPPFVCFFLSKRYMIFGIIYAIAMSAMFFLTSQGSRAMALGILGTGIFGYVFSGRIKRRDIAIIVVLAALLVPLSIATHAIRWKSSNITYVEMMKMIFDGDTYHNLLTRDPINYHQIFVAAVEHFPEDHSYLNIATYRRLILFFIPQKWSGGLKPEDPNAVFAEVIISRIGNPTFHTIPPSIFGDAYINAWGPIGVIGVLFLEGVIFSWLSRETWRRPILFLTIGALGFRLMVVFLRGQPYESAVVFLFSVICYWVLLKWAFQQTSSFQAIPELSNSKP